MTLIERWHQKAEAETQAAYPRPADAHLNLAGPADHGASAPQSLLEYNAAIEGCRLPSTPQDESSAHYYDRHSLPDLNLGDPLMVRALKC